MQQQMQQQMQKQMQEQMKQAAQQQGKKAGARTPKPQAEVSLVVNKRKNSIVAYAPPDKMVIIDQAIKVLDVRSNSAESPAAYINRTQVYRLETVDPEPVVKHLEELGDLDPNTRLEVDRQNRLIIAHASLIDHATIQLLVNKLDGGGRRCHVIPLKDLRAESVAQTITFMMSGAKEEQDRESDSRRSYDPFGYRLGGSSSRSRGSSQGPSDTFRVEPDVKNNALVLWANEFELAKVKELLESLRQLPPNDGDSYTVHVYRLASIDPQPVVKTLNDMDTLGPHATLQVDEANKAIIAYASPADHEKISQLLEKLDGSARKFAVVRLRRLEADYVAGTIEFMLGGGEKKETYQSRYDYYPYTDRMRPQEKEQKDQFRVDADVEYNRLLLWVNDIELGEVQNLLVKLGEIPEEGGSPDTVRVLDTGGGPELEALIERIRRTWTAPNQLIVIPPEKPEETTPKEQSPEPVSPSKTTTTQAKGGHLFRFALLSEEVAGGEASQVPAEEKTGAEVSSDSAKGAPAAGTTPVAGKGGAGSEASPGPEKADAGSGVLPDSGQSGAGSPASPAPGKGPAGEVSPDSGQSAGKSAPPVRISWGPDGRVIIASEDPKVLDALQDVLGRYAPPRRDYKVFHLKYALAYYVSLNLEDFFKEEEQGRGRGRYYDIYDYLYGYGRRDTGEEGRARLSKRRPLKFIPDSDTNTILVQGADPGQLKTVEELIKLYDQPEPKDTQSLRMTKVFHLEYSKAQVVADAIKDVYRDLLSSNDKALQQGPQQQRGERGFTINLGGDDGTAQKMPRWKGQLSIGIDELANALVVSAPAYLFVDVSRMIEELDQAAEPVSTVRVLKVDGRLSAAGLQEKLTGVLGGRSSGRQPSGRPPSGRPPWRRPGEGGPPRPSDSGGRSGGDRR
jgi:type II secretory pathway component GspD/PulD (secretin)